MYRLLWIFFVYAFLGWCLEVSFAALKTRRFVNRGFLNGPVCPIYGVGVVIVLLCLTPLKNNLPVLFAGGVVLTSALEYATGLVLEKLFGQRWWDYSEEPFNLQGYICLRFSLCWGVAILFVVKLLHPTVLLFISLIPRSVGWALLGLLGAVMAVDVAATVRTIARLNRRLTQIDEIAAHIRQASAEFGEDLAERVLDAAEKGADLKQDMDQIMDELSMRREELELAIEERREEFREDMEQRRAELEEDVEQWRATMAIRQLSARHYRAQRREEIREELLEWKEKLQDMLELEERGHRRLLRAFPKMRSARHHQALERLRRRFDR